MRRPAALLALLAVLGSLAAATPAAAARPSTGVFGPPDILELAWEGEAAGYGVSLFPEVSGLSCRQPFCDGYVFVVPEDLPKGTQIELTLTALESSGFTDVFVTDPPGTKTYHEGSAGEPATTVSLDDPVAGDWLVQVYTNTPAVLRKGSYRGAARMILPQPPG